MYVLFTSWRHTTQNNMAGYKLLYSLPSHCINALSKGTLCIEELNIWGHYITG